MAKRSRALSCNSCMNEYSNPLTDDSFFKALNKKIKQTHLPNKKVSFFQKVCKFEYSQALNFVKTGQTLHTLM